MSDPEPPLGRAPVITPRWSNLEPGIANAVREAIGEPSCAFDIGQGGQNDRALQLVTPQGAFFFKCSALPYDPLRDPLPPGASRIVWDSESADLARRLTIMQAEAEQVLPDEFPSPVVAAHGVYNNPKAPEPHFSQTAWLVSEWVEGLNAAERKQANMPGLSGRVASLAMRTKLPVTNLRDADRIPDFSGPMRQLYLGNWERLRSVLAETPQRFESLLDPHQLAGARASADMFRELEDVLEPELTGDYVVSKDAWHLNVMIADAGPAGDKLIDGVYGRGPRNFTALTLMLDAQDAQICDNRDLDAVMAAMGVSPEVTDAWLAGLAGSALTRRLQPGDTPFEHLGLTSFSDPGVLLDKLTARIAERNADSRRDLSRSLGSTGQRTAGRLGEGVGPHHTTTPPVRRRAAKRK